MEMEYRYDCCESPSILYIYSRLGRREDGRTGSRSSEKRRIYDKMDLGVRGGGWRRRRPGRWRWSARQSVTPGAIWPIRDRPQKWASFVPILRVEDEKWDTALRLSQKKKKQTRKIHSFMSPSSRRSAGQHTNWKTVTNDQCRFWWPNGLELNVHTAFVSSSSTFDAITVSRRRHSVKTYIIFVLFLFFSRLHYQLKITPNQTTR